MWNSRGDEEARHPLGGPRWNKDILPSGPQGEKPVMRTPVAVRCPRDLVQYQTLLPNFRNPHTPSTLYIHIYTGPEANKGTLAYSRSSTSPDSQDFLPRRRITRKKMAYRRRREGSSHPRCAWTLNGWTCRYRVAEVLANGTKMRCRFCFGHQCMKNDGGMPCGVPSVGGYRFCLNRECPCSHRTTLCDGGRE